MRRWQAPVVWLIAVGLCGCAVDTSETLDDGEWIPKLTIVQRGQGYDWVRYTRDGVNLYAEVYRPKSGRKGSRRAVVLVPGGFEGVNASHRATARRLAQAGFLVALPHPRGQGKSEGTIDFGLQDASDIRGLAKALTQLGGRGDYAYVGISFGAAIAMNAGRNDPKLRGIAYVMGPTDFREQRQILLQYGREDKVKRWDAWIGGSPESCPECYEARDPLLHAREVSAPLLIIQAGEDVLIPVSQACRLAQVRQEMGRTVRRAALTKTGDAWKGTLKERQQCVLPLTGWGTWSDDHLVLFPELPHRTNEAVWQLVETALNAWFTTDTGQG